jgi:hypothetical protein
MMKNTDPDDPYQLKKKQEGSSKYQNMYGILPEFYQVISQKKKIVDLDEREQGLKDAQKDLDITMDSTISSE